MKKVMFNDKYGLTQAVLEGRKIQTRRIADLYDIKTDSYFLKQHFNQIQIDAFANYKVGEELAVAQSYGDIINSGDVDIVVSQLGASKAGINNKMFVKPDLMPHRIKITNIRVERLQDISDEDCKAEGIGYVGGYSDSYEFGYGVKTSTGWKKLGNTFKGAYAALIDKICGKGTWEKNLYVFVYDFELVR